MLRTPDGSGVAAGGGRRGGALGARRRARALRGRLRIAGFRCDYVDDMIVGEVDEDLQTAVEVAGDRCTGLSRRSRDLADQNMAPKKCHGLMLRHAQAVGPTKKADVLALGLVHQCECGEPFASMWGLNSHQRQCGEANLAFEEHADGGDHHDVEALLEVRGSPDRRFVRLKWLGKGIDGEDLYPDRGTGDGTAEYGWQDERFLSEHLLPMKQAFFRANRQWDQRGDCEQDGEHRCKWCNRMFKGARYLKTHMNGGKKRKPCSRRPKIRRYAGTEVDRLCRHKKQEELLKNVPKCRMDGQELGWKLTALYLGSLLQGDGGCDRDVQRRLTLARIKFNELMYLWHDSSVSQLLKMRIYQSNVLSTVVWGSESWLLTKTVMQKLNGWNSRCVSLITGKSAHDEASPRKQSMSLPGIIQFRRMVWLGHLLRCPDGCLERRALLRYAELRRRKIVVEPGDFLMDAPAHSDNDMLIGLAGGTGTQDEREAARRQWKEWCLQKLSAADRDRRKKVYAGKEAGQSVKANTAEETAAALAEMEHGWRIYSDGGCDGNGAKGVWGASGFGVVIYRVQPDGSVVEIGNLYGPVVTAVQSEWWMGAEKGTNQTGEVCGVMQGLLWLLEHADEDDDDIVFCVDSLYAGNQLEGYWKVNCNGALVREGKALLARVRERRRVTFVHVKGHSADGGNDRADDMVQWGKSPGPFARMRSGGGGEGAGRFRRVEEGPVRSKNVEKEKEVDEDNMLGELLSDLPEGFLEWDAEALAADLQDAVPADRRSREPEVGRRQSLVDALFSESEEEEEKEEAQKKIDRVTEQIASGDVGGSSDTMQGLHQLEQITVGAGALRVENVRNDVVSEISKKMQNCWVNTIGYRITPVPTQFVVCDSVRSFTINVQGGSRGPLPNI